MKVFFAKEVPYICFIFVANREEGEMNIKHNGPIELQSKGLPNYPKWLQTNTPLYIQVLKPPVVSLQK